MSDIHLFSDHKIYQHIKIRTERVSKKNHEKLHELALNYKIEPHSKPVITKTGCYMEIDIKGFFDSIDQLIEFTERLRSLSNTN